ncbi:MAG: archaellin/type IV pilin N-terminal domain-containing protein [Halobacteriota archaeon]
MKTRKSLRKDKKGFTGLEAAIVLTAFVVVAAVFSYVVLNAGFFTTQKAKEVVHTGVEQATSSVQIAGDLIAYGNTTSDLLTKVTFYVTLTAGQNPIDLDETVLSYTNNRVHVPEVYHNHTLAVGDPAERTENLTLDAGEWHYNVTDAGTMGADNMVDFGEVVQVELLIPRGDAALNGFVAANEQFTIEIKPPQGASLGITKRAEASISATMVLY